MGFLSSLFGVSDRTPKTETIVQANKLPEELAPYVKDVLSETQAMYKAEAERGYDPYTGEMIAGFTPQEEQAMTGLEGMVGTTRPYLEEAIDTYRKGGDEFTAEVAEQYMSPYQQAVTDIEKAKTQETFERDVLPKVRQAQIGAGAFGGTRGTMLEAQALADQQRLVGDIQTKGSQAAYQDAVRAFEAQKAREGQTAGALAQLAPAAFRAQTG